MNKLWVHFIKPKTHHAGWLLFVALVLILSLGAAGYLDVVKTHLDTEALTFKAGDFHMSAYGVLKAAITLILIFWMTAMASGVVEKRIGQLKKVRTATRSLLIKLVQIIIYILAFLLSLDIIGIDLTALTIFSGALGIGLGFGLQKIASNFISGIILLLEKSVEQDDLIELTDGTFGFVRKANARFTLIETFDGKEIMIPNEDFITSRVVNWTYSNPKGRVEIALGVSYGSNIEKARELILEAAKAHPFCIAEPEPQCYLRKFGDSSVDFILHFWVADVTAGRWTPQSEVMFDIWNKFKDNNIQIPFPQRDLHLKTPDIIKVKNNGK